MNIQEVLANVNRMQSEGIIGQYAVGGAVGATFYLEPMATFDVDIFVNYQASPGQLLVSSQPIFDYLLAQGCTMQGEYVVIAGWPVQFLPPPSLLVEEALQQAVAMDVAGTPIRVFTAEYLAAIALETGRAKDKTRLLQFLEAGKLDRTLFEAIVKRHRLEDSWRKFQRQFLDSNS